MGMTEQQNVQTQEKQTLDAGVLSHCNEWECMWNKVKKTTVQSGKKPEAASQAIPNNDFIYYGTSP